MSVAYRKPNALDLRFIWNIEPDIWGESGFDIRAMFRLVELDALFVVFAGRKRVGFIAIFQREGMIYLAQITIKHEERGKGYGTEVMKALMDMARDQGKKIRLECRRGNHGAYALYKRLGFKVRSKRGDSYWMEWKP